MVNKRQKLQELYQFLNCRLIIMPARSKLSIYLLTINWTGENLEKKIFRPFLGLLIPIYNSRPTVCRLFNSTPTDSRLCQTMDIRSADLESSETLDLALKTFVFLLRTVYLH